jgi:hypothetical protein
MVMVLATAAMSCVVHAATIDTVISPTRLVVDDSGSRSLLVLNGEPVYACGMHPFSAWAARLEGQVIVAADHSVPTVVVDGTAVSLEKILVRSGWIKPASLDDDAQAAMTERRGGWACSSAQAPFNAMHTSVDPKILTGIALNESAYNGHAWPWTLNVAGRGFYFRTRDDAYRAIRTLLADGRCDFDVGIMQINRNLLTCYIWIRTPIGVRAANFRLVRSYFDKSDYQNRGVVDTD